MIETIEYSTTIINDGFSDGRYKNKSIKDVVGQIEYFKKCADCDQDLEGSEITVYISGTDELIAYKDANESLCDFLVELRQESKAMGE